MTNVEFIAKWFPDIDSEKMKEILDDLDDIVNEYAYNAFCDEDEW